MGLPCSQPWMKDHGTQRVYTPSKGRSGGLGDESGCRESMMHKV